MARAPHRIETWSAVLRPRRPLLFGAIAGALAVTTLLVVLGSSARRRDTPAPRPVAIMPFRVNAVDTTLGWLRDGMVEPLAIRLMGEGGMDIVEPSRSIAALRRPRQDMASIHPATCRRTRWRCLARGA